MDTFCNVWLGIFVFIELVLGALAAFAAAYTRDKEFNAVGAENQSFLLLSMPFVAAIGGVCLLPHYFPDLDATNLLALLEVLMVGAMLFGLILIKLATESNARKAAAVAIAVGTVMLLLLRNLN